MAELRARSGGSREDVSRCRKRKFQVLYSSNRSHGVVWRVIVAFVCVRCAALPCRYRGLVHRMVCPLRNVNMIKGWCAAHGVYATCQYHPQPSAPNLLPRKIRLIFMTSHAIEEERYVGDFLRVLEAYKNNDTSVISLCERQVIFWETEGAEIQSTTYWLL